MIEKEYQKEIGTYLSNILELHEMICSADRSIGKLYPIAVVSDNVFHVFDFNCDKGEYRFMTTGELPGVELPSKIFAAFPLPFYDGLACAVITEGELKNPVNHVFVFHEFVHCYQLEQGEMKLKAKLEIYNQAMSKGDMMWEINHPFPYDDNEIAAIFSELYESYEKGNQPGIESGYRQLKKLLSDVDFEYLVWQEWKEGYARWVENKMRSILGLEKNTTHIDSTIDRTIFYELGSRHIDYLERTKGKIEGDIIRLYKYMKEG